MGAIETLRGTLPEQLAPPQAIEAEQNVLGVLLLNNAGWDRISDVVQEQDFYRLDHRIIFRHIASLIENNRPADVLTTYDSLAGAADVTRDYLGSLAINCVGGTNIRRYAEIVRDRAQKRAIIATAAELGEGAYQHATAAGELVDGAIERLYRLQQQHVRSERQPIGAILTAVVERIDQLYAREDKKAVVGLATGFTDLDHMTAGLEPGDLIIVAGRPSMGKTTLAMNIVEHVAIEQKKPALVFSLEMSKEQLTQRMIGSVGKLNQHALRTGDFPESDWPRLVETVGRINESPVEIVDSNLTVADMRAIAHRVHRERGSLGLIVVDYLQLMQTAGVNRNNEIGDVTRSLKALAKELRVPVIALSQLSRGVEQRSNKRPVMSDLRDSGAIEQDADLILLVYRDEVYNEDTQNKGVAEIIIGKQRNGPTGTVNLTFLARFTKFENFAGEYRPAARTAPPRKQFEAG